MPSRKILIAGATGLVGYAAMKHFASEPGSEVIAVSRRRPDIRRALAAARSRR
jgi:NAD(P)-dependent dehydrogenase (short-subunit alcohol dehydrogenase family)